MNICVIYVAYLDLLSDFDNKKTGKEQSMLDY